MAGDLAKAFKLRTKKRGDVSPSFARRWRCCSLPLLAGFRRQPAKPCKASAAAMLAWLWPSRRGFCNSRLYFSTTRPESSRKSSFLYKVTPGDTKWNTDCSASASRLNSKESRRLR